MLPTRRRSARIQQQQYYDRAFLEEMREKCYKVLQIMDQKVGIFGRGLSTAEFREKTEVETFLAEAKMKFSASGSASAGNGEVEELRLNFEFLEILFQRRSREWERRVFNGMVTVEVFSIEEADMLLDLFEKFRLIGGNFPTVLLNDRIAFVGRTMNPELGDQYFGNVYRNTGVSSVSLQREILMSVIAAHAPQIFPGASVQQQMRNFLRSWEEVEGNETVNGNAVECPICMETLRDGDLVFKTRQCGHVFCVDCFNKSRRLSYNYFEDHKCALCRTVLETKEDLCLAAGES